MQDATRIAVFAALAAAAGAMFALVSPHFEAREQRAASERQARLIAAIRANDLAAVQDLVRRPVDIYGTDLTGESALSLAEQSGDRRLVDALAARRDRTADTARAQRAAEFGYAIGLRSPPGESDFDIAAVVREEADQARFEQRPPRSGEALADVIEREIDALPDGPRRQWALRSFANHLASAGLPARARHIAVRLDDPAMRGETLVSLVQLAQPGNDLQQGFAVARREIDAIAAASVRDPLYAQLAHFANLRGLTEPARETCLAIESPAYRTGICRFDAKPGADATTRRPPPSGPSPGAKAETTRLVESYFSAHLANFSMSAHRAIRTPVAQQALQAPKAQ